RHQPAKWNSLERRWASRVAANSRTTVSAATLLYRSHVSRRDPQYRRRGDDAFRGRSLLPREQLFLLGLYGLHHQYWRRDGAVENAPLAHHRCPWTPPRGTRGGRGRRGARDQNRKNLATT